MKFTVLVLTLSAVLIQSVWTAPTENVSASASLSAKHAAASAPGTYSLSLEKHDQNAPVEVNDILNVVADDSLLDDMVKGGWSEEQAEMVMSLLDAVDALTNFPALSGDEMEGDPVALARFNDLRADMNQLLAQAGYQYKSIGSRRRVLTRLDANSFSPAETEKVKFNPPNLSAIVHGIVSLIRSANEFSKLLNNKTLEDYTEALLEAAEMVEKVLTFPKGGLFSDSRL